MLELADKAISGDQQSFTDFRKLTACGLALVTGGPAAAAAAASDKSIFRKAVDYAVGQGKISADAAVESLIDRGASYLSTMLHKTISTAVSTGCQVAGGFIGNFFGPVGAAVGRKIGATIAGFLNTNISTLINKGISKVKDVAMSVYQKGKALLKSGFNKLKNWLFG